jgi:hypothetical protein
MAYKVPYIFLLHNEIVQATSKGYTKPSATSEKAKPDTENIRGLNLAAVKSTTVQLTRQPL